GSTPSLLLNDPTLGRKIVAGVASPFSFRARERQRLNLFSSLTLRSGRAPDIIWLDMVHSAPISHRRGPQWLAFKNSAGSAPTAGTQKLKRRRLPSGRAHRLAYGGAALTGKIWMSSRATRLHASSTNRTGQRATPTCGSSCS